MAGFCASERLQRVLLHANALPNASRLALAVKPVLSRLSSRSDRRLATVSAAMATAFPTWLNATFSVVRAHEGDACARLCSTENIPGSEMPLPERSSVVNACDSAAAVPKKLAPPALIRFPQSERNFSLVFRLMAVASAPAPSHVIEFLSRSRRWRALFTSSDSAKLAAASSPTPVHDKSRVRRVWLAFRASAIESPPCVPQGFRPKPRYSMYLFTLSACAMASASSVPIRDRYSSTSRSEKFRVSPRASSTASTSVGVSDWGRASDRRHIVDDVSPNAARCSAPLPLHDGG
mmetsp:Transcript_33241/g.102626  ORF Transcript_33241/g.102626 Transcript_33241/m.102626 type:complete len:292 (+) Transcript_33241:1141-2016(+)